jgi:hypothetical protein
MRRIGTLLAIAILALGAWLVLRDDGLLEQVTAARVEQALLDNRVPPPLASCMAPRLADQLSIGQLRALERAAPQDGESSVPLSTGEAMARLRRIDDPEAVKTMVGIAGGCGFELMLENL